MLPLFPGRSTLHPLFILRHLRQAAKKLKPRNSPRLHVAFIDFSQAYGTVPRQQLWSHLRRSAMPSTLPSVIKHMYENDEYILMDGVKRARVHPTKGVKQGCPLSPLLFSLYINEKKLKIRKSQNLTSPWSQATKTLEPHGLLGGGHGDRQAFITGST